MPNNIFIGANSVVAKQTNDFAAIGFNASNTTIIYEIGNSLKSWVPGRSINGITGIVIDKGYFMISLVDADLTAFFDPDFLISVPSERTITINGVAFDLSQNRSWTIVGSGSSSLDDLPDGADRKALTSEQHSVVLQLIQSFTSQ